MSQDVQREELYAAVLMPFVPSMREVSMAGEPNSRGSVKDGSILPFIIEELIGEGATFLAVKGHSFDSELVSKLPEPFRKRVIHVDQKEETNALVEAILEPVMKELQVQIDIPAHMARGNFSQPHEEALVWLALGNLEEFLLGMTYELQIEFDLATAIRHVETLLRHLTSISARVHVTMLKHIFGAYQDRTVKGFSLISASPSQRADAFLTFIEDLRYKELSKQRHLFGIPSLVGKALFKFDRLIDQISSDEFLQKMLALSLKPIEVATKLSVLDDKLLHSLEIKPYLPPIISLSDAKMRARESWLRVKPPIIPPAGYEIDPVTGGLKTPHWK